MAQGKHYIRLDPSQKTVIHLVGCGGTGSLMLTMLHRIDYALRAKGGQGIHVIAWDGDTVSQSNIGRQAFYPFDVGMNKASVLVTRLNNAYGLAWEARPEMFTQIPAGNSIILTCVDSASTRKKIAEEAKTTQGVRYWLDCGNGKDSGQVILGSLRPPGRYFSERMRPIDKDDEPFLPHVVDLFPDIEDHEEDSGPSCSLAEAIESQDLAVNPMVATHAFHLLWELLTKTVITTHGCYISLTGHMTMPMTIDREGWKRYGHKAPRKLKAIKDMKKK